MTTTAEHYAHMQSVATSTESATGELGTAENRVNTIRHLLAAMMLGQMYRQPEDAETIRKAVAPTMGDGRELRLSLAFAAATGGDATVANALLAEGIDDWKNAEMAKMTLAMSLKIAGDPEWKALPERALATSSNPAVRAVATTLLKEE
jgi:hypothetical protein